MRETHLKLVDGATRIVLGDDTRRAEAARAAIEGIIADGEQLPASVNLYDYRQVTNQAIIDSKGTISTGGPYRISAPIPVKGNTAYTLTVDNNRNEYRADGTLIKTVMQAGFNQLTFTTSPETATLRFNVEIDGANTGTPYDRLMFVEGTTLPAEFVPYSPGVTVKRMPLLRIDREQVTGLEGFDKPFAGKRWLAIGDSITEAASYYDTNDEITQPYHAILKPILGFAEVAVNGIGGSSIQKRSDQFNADYPPLCSKARIDALPDADVITVLMGVNDNSYPIGTIDSQDEKTLYGGLNSALAQLTAKYAGRKILFFTPLAFTTLSGSSPINLPVNAYNPGTTEVSAAIMAACRRWSIPCFDLNARTPFRGWSAEDRAAFIPDGLHPNQAGHRRMAGVMLDAMRSLATLG